MPGKAHAVQQAVHNNVKAQVRMEEVRIEATSCPQNLFCKVTYESHSGKWSQSPSSTMWNTLSWEMRAQISILAGSSSRCAMCYFGRMGFSGTTKMRCVGATKSSRKWSSVIYVHIHIKETYYPSKNQMLSLRHSTFPIQLRICVHLLSKKSQRIPNYLTAPSNG